MLSLFDIEVEQMYENLESKPKPERARKVEPKQTVEKSRVETSLTKKEFMDRLVLLTEKLVPYKDKTLDAIRRVSADEAETVRVYRIQVEQLKKALEGESYGK